MLLTIRVITLVLLLGGLIVALGFFARGVTMVTEQFGMMDIIRGVLFAGVGAVLSFAITTNIRRVFMVGWSRQVRVWFGARKGRVIAVTAFLAVLYALRFEIGSLFLFIGFNAGAILVGQARLAYLDLVGVDIGVLRLGVLAWALQWYVIYVVLGWTWSILARIARRRGRRTPVPIEVHRVQ